MFSHALSACFAALLLLFAGASYAVPALHKGINLSHWFQHRGEQPIRRSDLLAIRSAGFDHVRIPVDPEFLGWVPTRGTDMPRFVELRAGVELALATGLDIILDLHLRPDTMQAIEYSSQEKECVTELWAEIARRFSDISPDRIAFELLNEPQYYGWTSLRWNDFQKKLFHSVRAKATQHLVLATGRKGSSIDGLTELTPLDDKNVMYVFHFYLPYIFSHQGADWMAKDAHTAAAGVHSVPYPAALLSTQRPFILPSHRRRAEKELADYSAENWNIARIEQVILPAIKWAKKNKVRVICTEFGAIRASSEPQSRYRWIKDVRLTLERSDIGWTLWDYADVFGITALSSVASGKTERVIDGQARTALGLNK